MTNYNIDELYASAWENAIDNTAKQVKKVHGREYTRKEDWVVLEAYAQVYRLKFDINGEIV